MPSVPFDAFLMTLKEPNGALSPLLLAKALHMDIGEFAGLARVHRTTVASNPGSTQLQNAMREMMDVLAAAYRVNDDIDRVLFWFRNHPIQEFGYANPAELVREGKATAMVKYLTTLQHGATG